MKVFFKELFEYNTHYNQAIIAALLANPDKASEKSIKLMSHILNAHQVWNYRIKLQEPPYGRWDLHQLQDLSDIDKKSFELSMYILENIELNQMIEYKTGTGQVFNHSVRDILFQVINHSTYHKGQIAAEFRQCGMEPLLTDYIFYKMK